MATDRDRAPLIHGELISSARTFTLRETCLVCGAEAARVIELVEFGVVIPEGAAPESWAFSEPEVLRFKKALRLHRDLGIDPAGLALVLDLLDQIERLHREVERLRQDG
jgi:chaperone modulatory protein CbpM